MLPFVGFAARLLGLSSLYCSLPGLPRANFEDWSMSRLYDAYYFHSIFAQWAGSHVLCTVMDFFWWALSAMQWTRSSGCRKRHFSNYDRCASEIPDYLKLAGWISPRAGCVVVALLRTRARPYVWVMSRRCSARRCLPLSVGM